MVAFSSTKDYLKMPPPSYLTDIHLSLVCITKLLVNTKLLVICQLLVVCKLLEVGKLLIDTNLFSVGEIY